MNEVAKTFVFVGVAVVALVVALLARPSAPPSELAALTGEKPLNIITDPLSATSLEIVRWDDKLGAKSEFKVAQVKGKWAIPSHGDYPADAKDQMAAAATAVMNLNKLEVRTTDAGEHATYGVLDPEKAAAGAKGVGARVTMHNAKNETLVNMIVGTEVKGQAGQRYVREVGKDPVYVVKLDPSKLSTKFEDWIEKDLLKMKTDDLTHVRFNDYALDINPDGQVGLVNEMLEIGLNYLKDKSEWALDQYRKLDPKLGKFTALEVPEGQELNTAKLNEMKTALADLKIVNVRRKPKGLSRDLQANQEFIHDRRAYNSLIESGYVPVPGPNNSVEILSNQGDIVYRLSDGVEYVLRFGGIVTGEGAKEDEKQPDDAKKDPGEKQGENRFLLVLVRFNPDAIKKPERPAELGDEDETAADAPDGKKSPAAKEAGKEDAAEKEDAAKEDAAKEATEKGTSNKDADEDADSDQADADEGDADEELEADAEVKEAAAAKADEDATDSKAADAKPGDKKAEKSAGAVATEAGKDIDGKEKDAAKEGEQDGEAAKAAEKQQREALRKQYDAAVAAYDKQIKAGQDRVKELDARFGDWYFIISDSVFKKIHLTRTDIFKEKEAPKEAGADGENPLKVPTTIPGLPQGGLDDAEEE